MKDYKKVDPSISSMGWARLKAAEGFFDDGRSVEQQFRDVEDRVRQHGMICSSSAWRVQMIGGLRLRPPEWGALTGEPDENLIMTGCYPLLGIEEITAFCRLVQRLGGRYTFLTKEYCCSPNTNALPVLRGDEGARQRGLEIAREFVGMNVEEAKRLGVKKIYYVCENCAYHARRFFGDDSGVEHLYYMDLVVELIQKVQPRLRLEARAAYFEGCHAAKCTYLGPSNWDCNWPAYRACLDGVEGLDVVTEVPRSVCCWLNPKRVFSEAEKRRATIAVTPCWNCSTHLGAINPQSPYKGLSQILLQALEP